MIDVPRGAKQLASTRLSQDAQVPGKEKHQIKHS